MEEQSPGKSKALMLNSNDMFDFDAYTLQFKGGANFDFMDKLVHTQSFNNFIEETHKQIIEGDGQKKMTQIGFFKVNMDVMLEHGFKRLQKEQQQMIDHTLLNLRNPVKFSIEHIFKQYKTNLLNNTGQNNSSSIQLLVKKEMSMNKGCQFSILDRINRDIVMKMSGIQYDQISNHITSKEFKKTVKEVYPYIIDEVENMFGRTSGEGTASSLGLQSMEFQTKTPIQPRKADHITLINSRNKRKKGSGSTGAISLSYQPLDFSDHAGTIESNKFSYKNDKTESREGGNNKAYKNYISMADSQNLQHQGYPQLPDLKSQVQKKALEKVQYPIEQRKNHLKQAKSVTSKEEKLQFAVKTIQMPQSSYIEVNPKQQLPNLTLSSSELPKESTYQHYYYSPKVELQQLVSKVRKVQKAKEDVIQNKVVSQHSTFKASMDYGTLESRFSLTGQLASSQINKPLLCDAEDQFSPRSNSALSLAIQALGENKAQFKLPLEQKSQLDALKKALPSKTAARSPQTVKHKVDQPIKVNLDQKFSAPLKQQSSIFLQRKRSHPTTTKNDQVNISYQAQIQQKIKKLQNIKSLITIKAPQQIVQNKQISAEVPKASIHKKSPTMTVVIDLDPSRNKTASSMRETNGFLASPSIQLRMTPTPQPLGHSKKLIQYEQNSSIEDTFSQPSSSTGDVTDRFTSKIQGKKAQEIHQFKVNSARSSNTLLKSSQDRFDMKRLSQASLVNLQKRSQLSLLASGSFNTIQDEGQVHTSLDINQHSKKIQMIKPLTQNNTSLVGTNNTWMTLNPMVSLSVQDRDSFNIKIPPQILIDEQTADLSGEIVLAQRPQQESLDTIIEINCSSQGTTQRAAKHQIFEHQIQRSTGPQGKSPERGIDAYSDAFLKLHSHKGDMDNDPHTPQSANSLKAKYQSARIQLEEEGTQKVSQFMMIGELLKNRHDDNKVHQVKIFDDIDIKEIEDKGCTQRDRNFQAVLGQKGQHQKIGKIRDLK